MMLNPLSVGFGDLSGDTKRHKQVDDEPVTGSHPFGQCLSSFGQKHPAIGATRSTPRASPRDRLDSGGVRDAEAAGDVDRSRLATYGQIRNELDVVLKERC